VQFRVGVIYKELSSERDFQMNEYFIDENEISLETKRLILHYIVSLYGIIDQPDDGLKRGRSM
jgi:hypothetical protein